MDKVFNEQSKDIGKCMEVINKLSLVLEKIELRNAKILEEHTNAIGKFIEAIDKLILDKGEPKNAHGPIIYVIEFVVVIAIAIYCLSKYNFFLSM